MKRRDNDKKVNLLFLEMKNMMSALLQYVSIFNFVTPCAELRLDYKVSA